MTDCPNPLCEQGVVQYGEDTDSMTQCPDCRKAGRHGIAPPDPAPVCEWFARCGNPADGVREHPVIGPLPVCARCARVTDAPLADCERDRLAAWQGSR